MDKIFLCCLLGFAFSLILSPLVIKLTKKLKANQTIYEYVDMHQKKSGTPTMGGLIFLLGSLFAFFVAKIHFSKLATVCFVCFFAFGLIGFLDDFLKIKLKRNLGLRPYQKIIGQVAISIIIAIFAYQNQSIGSEIYIPFLSKTIDLGWFYIPFCIFVFLATTNGVNLTDGLDGLAGGVTSAYLVGFVGVSYIILQKNGSFDPVFLNENLNMLVACGGVFGALLAYLLSNSHPASIFMGDTGSLALGGFLACVAIFSKQVLLIPILGLAFVLSCVSVILQVVHFHFTKKRIFLMAPFHHHLEKKGMYETKIVSIYIIVTLVLSLLAIFVTLLANL